jgi:signal transduction histidine kinase
VSDRPRPTISVFAKLAAIMLTMIVALLVLTVSFFWSYIGPDMLTSYDRLVKEFTRAFVAGSPDLAAAQKATRNLPLQVRYEGPDGTWTTSDDLPSVEDVRNGNARNPLGRQIRLVTGPNGGTYLMAWSYRQHIHSAHLWMSYLVLVLIVGIVAIAYTSLRYLLRPLRGLGEGVARLSDGQLDVVLPGNRRDEFGLLTNAFNEMVGRVREMIRARDQLLLDVSHELRSPVTRLKVALELLPKDEKHTQMSADVAEIEIMISELLELERLRDGKNIRIARQDLMPILCEVVKAFADRPPGVQLLSGTQKLPLEIDADKLRIVFRNLLENAIKYSLSDSRPVQVSIASDEQAAVVRVTDDGPGIPAEDVSSLFEPFFRVDRSRSKKTGGYGLGLSICKRIVDAHGGSITVQNNPGRGASFIVSLPTPKPSVA